MNVSSAKQRRLSTEAENLHHLPFNSRCRVHFTLSLSLPPSLFVVAFELLRSAKMYWQQMKSLLKILEVSTQRKWLGFILVTGVKRIALYLYNMKRRQKPRWCQWRFCCSNTDQWNHGKSISRSHCCWKYSHKFSYLNCISHRLPPLKS